MNHDHNEANGGKNQKSYDQKKLPKPLNCCLNRVHIFSYVKYFKILSRKMPADPRGKRQLAGLSLAITKLTGSDNFEYFTHIIC